jgi:hypothetical protein
VVHDHAGLRQGERAEQPDREEWDQGSDVPVKGHKQAGRSDGEGEDAVGVDKPVAPVGKLVGHEPVRRDDRRQPREVSEACVCRQAQDPGRGGLQDNVGGTAAAEHRGAHL